jgi:hypothetical protein
MRPRLRLDMQVPFPFPDLPDFIPDEDFEPYPADISSDESIPEPFDVCSDEEIGENTLYLQCLQTFYDYCFF